MDVPGWFVALSLLGPPKLPPMPGQSGAAPSTPTPASKPATPSKPAAAPAPSTKLPTTAAPTPTPAPAATPPPSPELSLPPPEVPPDPRPTATPPSGTPLRASSSDAPHGDRPSLPRGLDDGATPWPRLPKPTRPPYDGVGLFAGAGVAFAAALTEQIVSHVLVKRRCIDPVARRVNEPVDEPDDAELLGEAVLSCIPGVLPAIALRVNSDLALAAMVGMVTAGTVLRGDRDAHDHAFAGKRRRDLAKLRGAGIGLVAGGAITWLTLSPTAWGVLAKCTTARCAAGARAMGFSVRDVGAVLVAVGAGMLGYAESYRRHHDRYTRDRAWTISPQLGPGMAGIGMAGRF